MSKQSKKQVTQSSKGKKPSRPRTKIELPPKPDLKNLKKIDKEVVDHFSPHVRIQLNDLMGHEKLISEKLKNAQERKLFLEEPRRFFAKHKIAVSPLIARKLKNFKFDGFIPAEQFVMPNGQKLTPKIKVNIKQ